MPNFGVETACLNLQEQGFEVYLLLTAIWLEQRQITFVPERWSVLAALSQEWYAGVISPIRTARIA